MRRGTQRQRGREKCKKRKEETGKPAHQQDSKTSEKRGVKEDGKRPT